MTYDKLETSILYTYSYDPELFYPCENLSFDDVWKENHNRIIFKIIKENHSKNVKTDLHILRASLSKSGYDKDSIKEILLGFNSADKSIKENIKEHMEIVFDGYTKRIMEPVFRKAYNQIFRDNGDIEEATNTLKDIFNEIDSVKNNLSQEKSVQDIFDKAYIEFEEAQNSDREIIGYETGLKDLDRITCGLKQEIIVIGAPPGAGKSTLMTNIITNVAIKDDKPVMVFSLEMPDTQLMKNIWGNFHEINTWQIRSGNVDEENVDKIKAFKGRLKSNLKIDDTAGVTWQYIETKVRIMRRQIPLNEVIVVIIDYLQLMKNVPEETKGTSNGDKMKYIVDALQQLSKKYNLCIIELSQLTKDSSKEKRRPTPADLRETNAIEANAVQIWLMYRPDYYEENPVDGTGMSLKGLCEINVAKNRYGETKPVYVRFHGRYSQLKDYNREEGNEAF